MIRSRRVGEKLGYVLLATMIVSAAPAAAQEVGAEFKPLFNGVNLVGWESRSGHAADWYVEDGEIFVAERSEGGGRMIHTLRPYEDFEFRMEYKLYAGGNSGVFIRMGEEGEGLEIQLLDDFAGKHANLNPAQYTGSLYGMAAPTQQVTRVPGEWQTVAVRVIDQQLTVTINGTRVVETDMEQYLASTTSPMRLEALQRRSGYIGIQNYGDPARFRNVEIRELS